MTIHKGTISGLHSSWGNGLAMLSFEDGTQVPCDNGPTVRAMESVFGGVVGAAHTIDPAGGHVVQEVFNSMDDFGLTLGWFVPIDEATDDLIDAYESQGGAA